MQETTENLSEMDDGVDDDGYSAGTIKPVECVPSFCNEIDNHQVQRKSDINKLKSKGIICYNMSWKLFKEIEWYVDSKLIDLIISHTPPFPSISFVNSHRWNDKLGIELQKSEFEEMSENCKPFLKPGGYFIIIMPLLPNQEWFESFNKAGFHVMRHPFVSCTVRPWFRGDLTRILF